MSTFNTRLVQSVHLRQEMKINPRLYQAMELLYMPLLDLQQHLKQELAENPFLEMTEADVQEEVQLDEEGKEDTKDEIDWEEILLDGFDAGGRKQQYEHREYFEPAPVEIPDLQDHLLEQLRYQELSEREARLGEEIIGNVDDDGSLSCTLEEVLLGINDWLEEARPVALERAEELEDEEEREEEKGSSRSSWPPTTWRRSRPCWRSSRASIRRVSQPGTCGSPFSSSSEGRGWRGLWPSRLWKSTS
jgi:hypothetical protein